MIQCKALRWGAPGQPLTPSVDFQLPKGSLTAVIGANGSGKSSLLKVIAGLQKPLTGKVIIDVPRKGGLSFLPQQQHLDRQFPISLQELVAAGFWGSKQTPEIRSQRLKSALEDWCLTGLEHRLGAGRQDLVLLVFIVGRSKRQREVVCALAACRQENACRHQGHRGQCGARRHAPARVDDERHLMLHAILRILGFVCHLVR